jgi:predicted TIM-barrel enzyme
MPPVDLSSVLAPVSRRETDPAGVNVLANTLTPATGFARHTSSNPLTFV